MTPVSGQHCHCWRPQLMVTYIEVALQCTIHLQGLKPGSSSLAQPCSSFPFPANRRDMCGSNPRVWGLQMVARLESHPHILPIPVGGCRRQHHQTFFCMLQPSLCSGFGCGGLSTTVKHLVHWQVSSYAISSVPVFVSDLGHANCIGNT